MALLTPIYVEADAGDGDPDVRPIINIHGKEIYNECSVFSVHLGLHSFCRNRRVTMAVTTMVIPHYYTGGWDSWHQHYGLWFCFEMYE